MKRILAFILLGILTIVLFGVTVFLMTENTQRGALQVTSTPNSKVYLDGKLLGKTPLCKCQDKDTIKEGSYTIRLTSEEGDFPVFEQKITISPKVLTVVDRTFTKDKGSSATIITLEKLEDKNSISLQFTSFPQGAKVFLDGSFIGDSPLSEDNVTESDHELRISKEGYEEKKILAKTIKGYRLEVQVFLVANPKAEKDETSSAKIAAITKILILQTPTGFLRVRSEPSLAGGEIGRVSPGEEYELLSEDSGWYKIEIKKGTFGWVSSQYAEKEI